MKLKAEFLCLFLIFISLGVYYPTMFAPLNSLDDYLMVDQLLNQNTFSLRRHFAPGGTYDYFRPLITLTFELDKYVGGLEESFMHLVNILLHTLNVILVFLLSRRFARLVGREGDTLPFLAAALFCLHPINTEAINWIAGRSDLLAGTFVLISLIFLFKALEYRSIVWCVGSVIALFCGFLCKETPLFILPAFFLILVWRPKTPFPAWRGRWVIVLFCLAAVALYFTLRWGAYTNDRGIGHTSKFVAQIVTSVRPAAYSVTANSQGFPFMEAVRVTMKVSGYYATKLFQPLPLTFAIDKVESWYVFPGLALAIILSILVFRLRPVGLFFVMSAFLGSSALLVLFTRLAWTPIAERYMYIPCSFFSIALVFGSADLVERLGWQKIVAGVIPLLLATSAWATVNRNMVWQDNLTLYQDTVQKAPDFGPARNQLAIALYAHHRPEEARIIIESTRVPEGQIASLNDAAILAEKGDCSGARAILLKRLMNPGVLEGRILTMLVKVTMDMAVKISDQSEKRPLYQEIVGWLERLESLTGDPFHLYQMGRVQLILKNRQEAQRCFSKAASRFPSDSIYKSPATKLARDLAL